MSKPLFIVRADVKEYKCETCNVTCNSESILQDHMSGKRHLKKVNAIEFGPPNKRMRSSLNASAVESSNYTSSNFQCSICELGFQTQTQLSAHNASSKHTTAVERVRVKELLSRKDPSVYCDVCDCMGTPSAMKAHYAGRPHMKKVLITEGGMEANKEPKTTQSTANKSILSLVHQLSAQLHQIVESKRITQHECAVCSVKFVSNEQALVHIHSAAHLTSLYNVVQPFQCDTCSVSFRTQEVLNAHLQGFKHAWKFYHKKDPEGPHREKILKIRENNSKKFSVTEGMDKNELGSEILV